MSTHKERKEKLKEFVALCEDTPYQDVLDLLWPCLGTFYILNFPEKFEEKIRYDFIKELELLIALQKGISHVCKPD